MRKIIKLFALIATLTVSTYCFAENANINSDLIAGEFKVPSGNPVSPNLFGRCQRADTISGLSSFIGALGPAEDFRVTEFRGKKYFVNYSVVTTPHLGFVSITFYDFDTLQPKTLEEVIGEGHLSDAQAGRIQDQLLTNRPGQLVPTENRSELAKIANALRSEQCQAQMVELERQFARAGGIGAGAGAAGEVIFDGEPATTSTPIATGPQGAPHD